MNIMEIILSIEQDRGLGGDITVHELKTTLKDMEEVDYVIDRSLITYLYHTPYERYRCNQCWLEIEHLRWFHVTANYNVIHQLIQDPAAVIELYPRRKYFEVVLQGDTTNDENRVQTTEEAQLPFT
jgi:hypothetical protein|tara:strand:- start:993 stop:1370 length:378 start_codon:yes stop_codon:yes gene_type:complete